MTSITLPRVIILSLIAGALLFLRSDQIRNPLFDKNAQYSFVRGARVPAVPDKQNLNRATRSRIEQAYGKLPIRFEANEGQTDSRVKFLARGAGYSVFLTGDETVLQLHKREWASGPTAERQTADQSVKSMALRMKLAGSNRSSRVSGVGRLSATSNYFTGNDPAAWRRGVSNYSKVKYESVYPGIDLVWYGNQHLLEHDFLIAPGADPSRIKLSFSGTDKMSIDDEGAVVLRAGGENLRLLKPLAWQESNGSRRTISCDYRLGEMNQVEFRLGDYDTKQPLIIDPVLVYSTYIGGIGTDSGLDIAVDGAGAAYISGQTDSADFPGPSTIQAVRGTLTDAYVLKINPAGDAIVFGAWIGGNGSDTASAVSVDPSGNVYLAGLTTSTNFPLQNPLQTSRRGISDAFAVKIGSSGSMLLYSTYIGGAGADSATALAVDGNGNLYLTGSTDSGDFPVVNAFQPVKNGSGAYARDNRGESWGEIGNGLGGADVNDLVIFPGDSSTLFAGTDRGVFKSLDRGSSWNLLGGTQFIRSINQVIVDPTSPDILYAVSVNQLFKSVDGGATWILKPISLIRTASIDPTTPSKLYAGTSNGLSISADGGDSWTTVVIPPIIGGAIGQVDSIAVDPITSTTVYIGTSQGIYKSLNGGATWTFAGNGLPISAPPTPPVRIVRIAISRSNPATIYALADNSRIFKTAAAGGFWVQLGTPVIGITTIAQLHLPLAVASDNPDIVYVGSRSSGIFSSNDGGGIWNTVNNGLNASEVRSIVIDSNSPERVYTGTDSGTEAFVAKLDTTGSSFVYSSYLGGGASESGAGIVVDSDGGAYIAGSTTSPNFPVVNAFQATRAGQSDAFVVKVNDSGSALSWATFLGGSNSDNATGIALSAAGKVLIAGSTTSSNFPLNNAAQPLLKGTQDGFITRLKNDGSGIDFSTYLGGAGFDVANAIAVDSAGASYVTGLTTSLDFPVINAIQSTRGGNPASSNFDAFVTKLSADGSAIDYSTYLGGSGSDQGASIAVDASANAYVTGIALSSDFPTTPFPIRSAGPSDAFVTKIGASADLAITLAGAPNPVMINNQLTYSLIVTNNGPDQATGVRVTETLPGGVSLASSASSQGSCSGGSVINCDLGNLAPGSNAEITIIVTPSTAGTIANRASVTGGNLDNNPANNSATLETNVSLLPSIFGRVSTAGGAGLSGVSIAVNGTVRPPLMTTDNGKYQFAELARGGGYTVTPSRQGYVFNPPNRTINNLQSDQRADFQGVACTFSISPTNQSFPATGGMGSVTITSSDSQCPWTATSNVAWIRITSAPTGNGAATVSFKVEPTVGSRTGTITIGGNKFTVLQEFNPCGSVTFNTPKILSLNGASGLSTLVADDFNNDSVSDLVIQGSSSTFPFTPVLTISLSNSAGGYDSARPLFTGFVRAIRAGDLNKDGLKDLALTTNEEPARLLILTGNGAGGFSAPVRIETGPSPIDLAIADFNSDSIPDLAVVTGSVLPPDPTQSSYNLAIHLGDGTGGFAAPRHIGFTTRSGSVPTQFETGDFNGDRKPDLALSASSGPAIIFTADGAAGFTISTLDNVFQPGAMALGDFNGDLKSDIAIREFEGVTRVIKIWVSTTTGILQPVQSVNAEKLGSGLFSADFNGDGKSDLGARADDSIAVLYSMSDGRFAAPEYYLTGGNPNIPVIGDFKSDGKDLHTDIFVPHIPFLPSSPPAIKVTILTSDALRGFDAPRAFDWGPTSPSSSSFIVDDMESGDLNGDGALDLVIAASNINDAVMMFGNGRGEFGAPVSINSGVTDGVPVAIELRDFNRDGKMDLALLNSSTDNVVILLGAGRGEFMSSAVFNTGSSAKGLASSDFNNDGHLDLAVTAQSGGFGIFLGDGQGGFTQSATGIGGNLVSITFNTGDFNGDGNADLALFDDSQIPTPGNINIVVLYGNGQGGFGDPINIRTEDRLSFITAADLNLDGRDDLIYTQLVNSTAVFVALSNPGGGFAAPVRYQTDFFTRSVVVKDINGDSKPDLFVPRSASILLGRGDGSFSQPVKLLEFDSPGAITAGDLDEDGGIDLVISQNGSTFIGVLLNKSMCAPNGNVVPASAASKFRYRVARNSIVTLEGKNLAPSERTAIPPFLPTSLVNTRVKVRDSAGVERLAPLYFVSPDRITHLIPAQTATGVALITVMNNEAVVAQGTATIAATAPGLFSADLSGLGYAAALVLRVRPNGSRVFEPVTRFDFEQNHFIAVPIDLSNEADEVFLLLSGTGIRNHSGLANVRAKIGFENAEVTFAGAEGILPGADQVNVRLQSSLRRRGEVSVELLVDGRAANTLSIKIK